MADQLQMLPDPTPAAAPRSTPDGFRARELSDFDRFAHEVHGVRADARWIVVETLGDHDTPRALASFRLVMAVPPTLVFKSGPRKGEINWSRRDKSHDRELIVSFKDFDAFVEKRVPAKEADRG